MKIGILGTGVVGTTLGTHLLGKGHQVMLGSREPKNENSLKWIKENSMKGYTGTFSEAALFGNIAFNCTMGIASLDALKMVNATDLDHKILIDVANPIDFTAGMPPRLTICNDHSLGEEIQKLFPKTNVVKALNTVNYEVMINPAKMNQGQHEMFICGENAEAKQTVTELLVKELGWYRECVIDLGGIVHARSTEALLLFIISLSMKYGTFYQGVKTCRG